MKNVYVVRTATVASLAAAVLGLGLLGIHSDEMQIAPDAVAVAGAPIEPGFHFPSGFEIRANADEPEMFEYY